MLILYAFISLIYAQSNGWNDDINWLTMDEAKSAAAENGKPIMLIIHKRFKSTVRSLESRVHSEHIICGPVLIRLILVVVL